MPPIMPEPHWTQIMTALLTPTITVLAGIIAYRQWRTAQNKLRFDLFDRRFAVYDAARNLLSSIMTTGQVQEIELFKFLGGTREAKWLLNLEIANYFQNELWERANSLSALNDVQGSLTDKKEREENIKKQSELKSWFQNQYNVLDRKFEPFLKLKH